MEWRRFRTVAGAMHPLILQAVEEARFVPVFDSRQVVGQGLATGTAGVDSAWRRSSSSLAGSDFGYVPINSIASAGFTIRMP